jgi:hypothetical protein
MTLLWRLLRQRRADKALVETMLDHARSSWC